MHELACRGETHAEGFREYGAENDFRNLRKLCNVDCEGEINEDGVCSPHGTEEKFKQSFNLKVEGKKL
jgi:hypothetical protein